MSVEPARLEAMEMTRARKALLVVGTVAALLLPGMAHVGARQARATPLRLVHVVRRGETLWQIAGVVAPGKSRTATIDRLISTNHLRTPAVHSGQPLFLPAS